MGLYQEAAGIIQQVRDKRGTVKSLVLSHRRVKNTKQLYALVCETLKYSDVLDQVIDAVQICKLEKTLQRRPLAQVVVYDLLIGKGLKSDGNLKAAVWKHKAALSAELARLKVRAKVASNEGLLPEHVRKEAPLPRYVRVNLLKTNVEDVIGHFESEGYSFDQCSNNYNSYEEYLASVKSLTGKHFLKDFHLPNVLVFPPGKDFHQHPLYTDGSIILQDKASCIPAHILSPLPGSNVIDCCAAPGNKTSQLAAVMNNEGKLHAFDKDGARFKTLKSMLAKAGVQCAHLHHQDFLKVSPLDKTYQDVEFVLVDPSCSGSGIVSRLNSITDKEDSTPTQRLGSLASFQASILKHALSFPNVRRVVYSTCSTHREENEEVVQRVLLETGGQFHLTRALPNWTHRGLGDFEFGHLCLRASAQPDYTNGFFVACLERCLGDKECLDCYHGDGDDKAQANQGNLNSMNTNVKRKQNSEGVVPHVYDKKNCNQFSTKVVCNNGATGELSTSKKSRKRRKLNGDCEKAEEKLQNSVWESKERNDSVPGSQSTFLLKSKKNGHKKRKRKKTKKPIV
ncbi:probable 28S rRNA (cytosine-C(5))-methyltransferase [Lingula anatina]|uniref:Probable 28S rRNA (Cytosine-C(5))-methyltransferase n=1 Tax=Lingula anatina TaxID=7574 RepID=A0A1S3JHQ5_LINAN|nr:probable 28S rRNA (cytosine-C(5))-methyltransferase [Lingula anatina]|eukprot:XP_013409950.1 probable 28S rRNA (cytosine-C(5))-methyltransferase [Lingula anatina]